MFSPEQIKLFSVIASCASEMQVEVYIVGGVIRDIFLGRDPADKDVDFIVEGDAGVFADYCLAKIGGTVKKFPDFLTAKVLNPVNFNSIAEVDFASSRKEVYRAPGKLPEVVSAPISGDLSRRDFTINAMAVKVDSILKWAGGSGGVGGGDVESLEGSTLDFFSGLADIKTKKIRVMHDKSFLDDPTRIFRAVRYAARIGGELEDKTSALLRAAVDGGALGTISKQRVVNEIKKILLEPDFPQAFMLLNHYGVISSLSLYDIHKESEVIGSIKEAIRVLKGDKEPVYQVSLRIFHHFQPAGGELSLGLGENELKKIAYDTRVDLDLNNKQVIQRLSKHGQVFQNIMAGKAA